MNSQPAAKLLHRWNWVSNAACIEWNTAGYLDTRLWFACYWLLVAGNKNNVTLSSRNPMRLPSGRKSGDLLKACSKENAKDQSPSLVYSQQ